MNGIIVPNKDSWVDISSQVSINNDVVNTVAAVVVIKKSGIVIVDIRNITFKNAGNAQTLLTGLPKAVCQVNGIWGGSSAQTTASLVGDGFWIDTQGTNINGHIGVGHQASGHWITIIYPTNE